MMRSEKADIKMSAFFLHPIYLKEQNLVSLSTFLPAGKMYHITGRNPKKTCAIV
jgi:hypothetical protein